MVYQIRHRAGVGWYPTQLCSSPQWMSIELQRVSMFFMVYHKIKLHVGTKKSLIWCGEKHETSKNDDAVPRKLTTLQHSRNMKHVSQTTEHDDIVKIVSQPPWKIAATVSFCFVFCGPDAKTQITNDSWGFCLSLNNIAPYMIGVKFVSASPLWIRSQVCDLGLHSEPRQSSWVFLVKFWTRCWFFIVFMCVHVVFMISTVSHNVNNARMNSIHVFPDFIEFLRYVIICHCFCNVFIFMILFDFLCLHMVLNECPWNLPVLLMGSQVYFNDSSICSFCALF